LKNFNLLYFRTFREDVSKEKGRGGGGGTSKVYMRNVRQARTKDVTSYFIQLVFIEALHPTILRDFYHEN